LQTASPSESDMMPNDTSS